MNKKLKKIMSIALLSMVALTGCGGNNNTGVENNVEESIDSNDTVSDALEIEVNIDGEDYTMVFEEVPTRVATMTQYATEMLLALGLEDHIVATAYTMNDIYPGFEEAYDSIDTHWEQYPSKEAFIAVEPDFVMGFDSAFREDRLMSVEELLEYEANSYVASSVRNTGSIETVYEDFRTLGVIFNVEDKAEEVIASMQKEIEEVQEALSGIEEKKQVLFYDSGEEEPLVIGGGAVQADIARKAMTDNIFDEIDGGYVTVSWEEIVDRNPEAIVIVDYPGDKTVEEKIDFLKSHPALQDVTAIKEDNFSSIGLEELSAGIRNPEAIRKIAEGVYPEAF